MSWSFGRKHSNPPLNLADIGNPFGSTDMNRPMRPTLRSVQARRMRNLLPRSPFVWALALMTAASALSAANARSTTGFGAFKVQNPNTAPTNSAGYYGCLLEDNGAVLNDCGVNYEPTLVFDLPIDNTGNHGIVIQPYWGNSQLSAQPKAFQCTAYAYAGSQPISTVGTSANFTMGGQSQTVHVNVSNNGMSIALICWNVPFGEGIANINWSA